MLQHGKLLLNNIIAIWWYDGHNDSMMKYFCGLDEKLPDSFSQIKSATLL